MDLPELPRESFENNFKNLESEKMDRPIAFFVHKHFSEFFFQKIVYFSLSTNNITKNVSNSNRNSSK